jgi:hypothetical protein
MKTSINNNNLNTINYINIDKANVNTIPSNINNNNNNNNININNNRNNNNNNDISSFK